MENESRKTVNLLWTGGLDSTYRLLEILLKENRKVQPYYMLDAKRFSLRNEIDAMHKIKQKIIQDFQEKDELLLPIKFIDVEEIDEIQLIKESFQELKKLRHIGIQYKWMAEFCIHNNINDLELGIIRKGEASDHGEALSESLDPYITSIEENSKVFKIDPKKIEEDGSRKAKLYNAVFGNYHLPIIAYSKREMVNLSKQNNWMDYINLTWYCHNPKKNKIPCGKCNPCKTAKQEGVARKVPLIRWKYFYKDKYS